VLPGIHESAFPSCWGFGAGGRASAADRDTRISAAAPGPVLRSHETDCRNALGETI
jgi:hypothetical protein